VKFGTAQAYSNRIIQLDLKKGEESLFASPFKAPFNLKKT
jgi:hypothetical protein